MLKRDLEFLLEFFVCSVEFFLVEVAGQIDALDDLPASVLASDWERKIDGLSYSIASITHDSHRNMFSLLCANQPGVDVVADRACCGTGATQASLIDDCLSSELNLANELLLDPVIIVHQRGNLLSSVLCICVGIANVWELRVAMVAPNNHIMNGVGR